MKFNDTMAASVGLVVGGKSGTALVNPVHGFSGRRVYIDGGSRANGIKGSLIHLSGFHPDEVQALGAFGNPDAEYSARVTGFLVPTPANLAAACAVVRDATTPAYEPARASRGGILVTDLFAQAAALSK